MQIRWREHDNNVWSGTFSDGQTALCAVELWPDGTLWRWKAFPLGGRDRTITRGVARRLGNAKVQCETSLKARF